jgi:hypothetical protein
MYCYHYQSVLPIIAEMNQVALFSRWSLLNFAEEESLDLGALGLLYEKHQSGLSDQE